jgi:hypothetical protein
MRHRTGNSSAYASTQVSNITGTAAMYLSGQRTLSCRDNFHDNFHSCGGTGAQGGSGRTSGVVCSPRKSPKHPRFIGGSGGGAGDAPNALFSPTIISTILASNNLALQSHFLQRGPTIQFGLCRRWKCDIFYRLRP